MRDLAKSYKFQLELLPLLHNYFTSKPDEVKFTDTQKSYTYGGYGYYGGGYYTGSGIKYYGGKGVYSSLSDFDEEDMIDDFMDIIVEVDRACRTNLYQDLMHVEGTLTKTGKSLRLHNLFATCPDVADALSYYFTIRQDKNQDALIPVKEIKSFKLEVEEPLDWDSLDNGGLTD